MPGTRSSHRRVAHRSFGDPQATYEAVGGAIATTLQELEDIETSTLLDQRLEKYDALGAYETGSPATTASH
jgi:acetyl-CoA carboxylase carboxyl transferase subunit alpha